MLFTEIALALWIGTLKPTGLWWKNYNVAKSLRSCLANHKMPQGTRATFSLPLIPKMKFLIWTSSPIASISRYVVRHLLIHYAKAYNHPQPTTRTTDRAKYRDSM